MPADARNIIEEWERLDGDRYTWKTLWQQVAQYMLPERNDYIVERTPGMKRMQYVFDATPILANQRFAAGLHSRLTSPTLLWFVYKTHDDRLNRITRVQQWLEAATQHIYDLVNSPRLNFASQSHEVYLDLGSIGTAVMAVLDNPKRNAPLFSTKHLKECVVDESEEDRVDTLCRRWKWSAKQAVQQWGESAGKQVLEAYNTPGREHREFEFLHMVRPRRLRDASRRDARHKAWESVYVSYADTSVITEGGFDGFPYLVPRFAKATGEKYGRGPGITALPDVQMLNEMAKTLLKAAQKIVDPPLQVPDDGFLLPIKTTPGSLNPYRATSQGRIEPIETKGDIPIGIQLIQMVQRRIMQIFYDEDFNMPMDPKDPANTGKGVTATFTAQNNTERMMLQSPMLARSQAEFTGPLLDRLFDMEWQRSVKMRFGPGSPFPPPPPELSGVPLTVEYLSPIQMAQRSARLDSIDKLLQMAMAVSKVNPQAGEVLDTEGILRETADDLNAPVTSLFSPEVMAQKRQAAAQLQQHVIATSTAQNLAGAAKDGAGAVKSIAQARQVAQPQQQQVLPEAA